LVTNILNVFYNSDKVAPPQVYLVWGAVPDWNDSLPLVAGDYQIQSSKEGLVLVGNVGKTFLLWSGDQAASVMRLIVVKDIDSSLRGVPWCIFVMSGIPMQKFSFGGSIIVCGYG
jgi:hypothetical protein